MAKKSAEVGTWEDGLPSPAKTDSDAPKYLKIIIQDSNGETWNEITAPAKHFSSGSVGFWAGDKLTNPESGERYQMSCSFTLIGSKPT